MNHLTEKIKKHESSAKHLRNSINLATLGSVNISVQLSKAYRRQTTEYNQKVRNEREVLSKIIDCSFVENLNFHYVVGMMKLESPNPVV